MQPLCIYHGGCDDGFAAAWVVRRYFNGDVELYAGQYQKEPPDVTGREVILVDFSYKRPVLMEMAAKANTVLILDHHKTAAEDLAGFKPALTFRRDQPAEPGDNIACVFDMARSGAGLAWDFFNEGEPRPEFINYIEDRDLWTKKLFGVDEFTASLRSYPMDFEVWDKLIEAGPAALIGEGFGIQRYFRARVEELKKGSYKSVLIADTGDGQKAYACEACNAPYFAASEVAGEISDMPGACFGLVYFEGSNGQYYYSLRSRGDFDVSAIAKCFGGGGHKNAAGFKSTMPVHSLGGRHGP